MQDLQTEQVFEGLHRARLVTVAAACAGALADDGVQVGQGSLKGGLGVPRVVDVLHDKAGRLQRENNEVAYEEIEKQMVKQKSIE